MAEADLDSVIRSIAKKQHKILMDAAKQRQRRLTGMAAKAGDKAAKARYKHLAKTTLLLAAAAAERKCKSRQRTPPTATRVRSRGPRKNSR